MAQTIKLKRSATQGAAPTTSQLELGEIAINTYDGKVYIKKDDGTASIVEVGTSGNPVLGGIDTYTYTATASQTTFSGSDDNSATLSYTVGDIQVFLNGVLLDSSDYTATNGTSIVLASGAAVNDKLVVSSYTTDTVSNLAYYDDTTANFTGTLQNGGSNVVVDSDIGSTVQAYDADTAKYDDTTANFTGTLQNGGSNVVVDTDIGSTVQAYDADTAKYDDTTANFTGTLQNAGSNVVVDSDIGSTVQAYDADTAKYDDTTANFTGTLQNAGSDVVVDSDIGSTVQAYDSNLTSFVSAFTLPTSDGTADQVLTTDGSGTLSFADASGGGGGGSFTATASGTLSDGTLVVVNSDGTVSSAATLTATESLGSGTSYESGSVDNQRSAFVGSDKIVVLYRDTGNSDYATVVVGTVSGTSISFGTPAVFHSGNITSHVGVAYDSANDKVVIAYRDSSNSNYGTAMVGTVSGTSISFGTPVVFNSGGVSSIRIVYDSANGKIVIVWGANGAIVGTVSGTSISFGSTTTLAASGVSVSTLMEAVYDSANGKIVVIFRNGINSNYGEVIIGTVSGTSISFGSKVTFLSAAVGFYANVVYDSANAKVVIVYENDGSSSRPEAIVGTVSGTSISFGSPTNIETTAADYTYATYDSASGEIVAFYHKTADSKGYYAIGSVSGTSITFGTPVTFANDVYYLTAAYNTSARVNTFFYYTGDTSNMQGRVFRNDYNIQKLTAENFVGISDASYSDGATATIQTFGSVDDAQTGLTAGQAYYVQTDGTLSTTVSSPAVLAGVAISSTELLIATSDLAGALISSDIGSTVQAYDADTAKYDDTTANFTGTLQQGGSDVVVDTDIGSTVQAYDSNLTSFVSAFTLPTSDGTADQVLTTNGSGTLSFADASGGGGGGTLGTLTKTFTTGEESTITLSSSVLAPVVSVTKEVVQSTVTNNSWDVNSTTENYTRVNSAPATTLTPSATGDGTFTLGTGSFAAGDVGKTIIGNGGVAILTATDGSYVTTTDFTDTSVIASGSWEMYAVVYNTTDGDLELSNTTAGFDVSTASYSQNFSVSSQDTVPADIAFNTDGTKMFIVGNSGDDVNEYTLGTGFDVSTATYSQNFSVSSQDTSPVGIAFNNDGTKMFIVGFTGDDVNEYTLGTGFDVSTATYSQNFSVSAQDTSPYGIAFNTDGTKMFIVGYAGGDVNEYTLGTGFDVSTASYSQNFSVSAQDTSPTGLAFNTDGTKMFIVGTNGQDVNEYTLSTGFDVSTASYSQNFSVASQDTDPQGIAFNADGTKMFIVGNTGDEVNEYTVGTTYTASGYHAAHTTTSTDSTYWTDINSMTVDQTAGDGNVYYAVSTDDRTTWSIASNTNGIRDIVRNNSGTWQYNSHGVYGSTFWTNATTNTELSALEEAVETALVPDPFDVSAASYSQNFSVLSQDPVSVDIAFNTDGTKMFIVGFDYKNINEYTLSTGFDVSTASYSQNFSVSTQDTEPYGIAFNTDGTKMFIVGRNGQDVNEYTLSTGFDVSTASYSQNFSVSSQDTYPNGIGFNTDGTKMFIVGGTGDAVYEYTLSTGFDVSTASYSQNFSVSSQDTAPFGITFNNDGTKMFIVGGTGVDINEYTLSTAFDVSTASFVDSLSVSSRDATPRGIAFNNDGTKMFVVGWTNDKVYEYTVGSATAYPNRMNKTQLEAVTDANHFTLANDLDLAIIFNLSSGSTVPSSDGVSINYDANTLDEGAILGTDYTFNAPAQDKVRIRALQPGNYKVRVL